MKSLTRHFLILSSWKKKCLVIFIIFILYFLFSCFVQLSQTDRFDSTSVPLILLYTYNYSIKTRENICRGVRNGGHVVNFDRCSHKYEFSCRLEDFNHHRSPAAAAVLFFGEDFSWSFKLSNQNRLSTKQRWIFWSWEAPINHPEYTRSHHLTFNWTMTYRQDSDIVHDYGRYILRNLSFTIQDYQSIDYYLSSKDNQSTFNIKKEFKERKNEILWFVSNCQSRTKRDKIGEELKKYISIDQYGQCSHSNQTSHRNRNRMSTKDFEEKLFQYKYYFAFENAQCKDYISEKAFYNALAHGSIPIVFGTNQENYRKLLPPNSFLHLNDFKDFQSLTNEINHINKDIHRYRFYHQWRNDYRLIVWPSNYYIDNLFCNLCIKLYEDNKTKSYEKFDQWLNKCK